MIKSSLRPIGGVLFFFLLVMVATSAKQTLAGSTQSGFGWLWGGMSNTVPAPFTGNTSFGYVSMNSSDCDPDNNGSVSAAEATTGCAAGPIADYGVVIPTTDTDLSQYAWSENYGWISFNATDVSGCPVGVCSARRVGNNLVGWARILSIRSAMASGNNGGWSGYVSLDSGTTGSTTPYGVVVTGNALGGFAWSDELGWIDFSRAGIRPVSAPIVRDLQVCEGMSCSSGVYRANGASITMANTEPGRNYVACYADTALAPCTDPTALNVTNDPTTIWSDSNTPGDAVTLSGTDPKLVRPNAFFGGSRTETVTARYGALVSSFQVTVSEICISNCTAEAASHCPGSFNTSNSCGNPETCPTGTRSCDFNWKEVAPE